MDTEEAVTEFVGLLRVGTAALREIVSKDATLGPKLETQIKQLLFLAANIDEIGENVRNKTRSARCG